MPCLGLLLAAPVLLAASWLGEWAGREWVLLGGVVAAAVGALLLYLLLWRVRTGRAVDPLTRETRVYYAIGRALGWLAIGLGIIVLGLGLAFSAESTIWLQLCGGALALTGGVVSWFELGRLLNRRPQLLINATGIQWRSFPIQPWSEIKNARVELLAGPTDDSESEFHLMYLSVKSPTEKPYEMAIELTKLDVDPIKLERHLHWARTGRPTPEE